MILAQLLNRSVAEDEPVLKHFVETMAEPFILAHALKPAKGSTQYSFSKNHDQSMVAHIFNGIFPTMRLVALTDKIRTRPYLSELGQKLYILGYCMHDIDKIRELGAAVDLSNQVKKSEALAMLQEELARVNAVEFLPDYEAYLDEILFLVVNTQKDTGAKYTVHGFNLKHAERELHRARELCTFSDCLCFLIKSPADILYSQAAGTIGNILRDVSQEQLSFVYHQFSDVRGLLTNAINNGVKELIAPPATESAQAGFIPYLFFPNGTVYIKTQHKAEINLSEASIWEAVKTKLQNLAIARIDENTPGFKFNNKSNLSYPRYFEDLLDPAAFTGLLVKVCLRTRANVTESTYRALQALANDNKLPAGATLDYYPADDSRIAVVGRFLLAFEKLIIERADTTEARDQLLDLLLQHFGFSKETWAIAGAIPSSGGLDFRYFWLGAEFTGRQRGLSPEGEDEGSLTHFLKSFVETARPAITLALAKSWRGELLPQLQSYVQSHLSFGGILAEEKPVPPDFAKELANYVAAKQRQPKLPCTVCNSPYLVEGRKQTDADVLFQPWIYKNRLPLYLSENAAGICAICLLEMMLRQLMQKDELRLTGKNFEDVQFKFFYLYPSYFFTTETADLVRSITENLGDFSISKTIKALADSAINAADIIKLDIFDAADFDEANPPRAYYKMEYDAKDVQGLIFFGIKALGRDPTASETWAVPAILGLMLPVVLSCKVVVSESYMPLFASGDDFKETVVLDAPHHFLSHLLTGDAAVITHEHERVKAAKEPRNNPAGRVRIDKLLAKLRLLSRVYFINYDTYSNKGDPGWNMLNRVARTIRTDPLNVFRYLATQVRANDTAKSLFDGYFPKQTDRYLNRAYHDIWQGLEEVLVGGNPMEIITGLVERYTAFYRPEFSSSSIVRPVEIATKLILSTPREQVQSEEEYASDIKLIVQGELMRWLDRLRNSEGSGKPVFWGKDISEQQAPALKEFADFFYDEVFKKYCRGQAGLLRSRLNNIKSGCEAYYTVNWKKWRRQAEPVAASTGNP